MVTQRPADSINVRIEFEITREQLFASLDLATIRQVLRDTPLTYSATSSQALELDRQLLELSQATGVAISRLAKVFEANPGQPPRIMPFAQQERSNARRDRRAVSVGTVMAHQLVTVDGDRSPGLPASVLHDECRRLKVPTEHRLVTDLRGVPGVVVGATAPYVVNLEALANGELSPLAARECRKAVETLLLLHLPRPRTSPG